MRSKLITVDLGSEFQKRINQADKVQIASAWMTKSSALEALLGRKECSVQAIIGIRGYATTPESLHSLVDVFGWSSLRIADTPVLFHPKLFLFHCPHLPTVAWVGSANFTARGMKENIELMLETNDASVVTTMEAWFDEQWRSISQNTKNVLAKYETDWRETAPMPELTSVIEDGLTISVSNRRAPVSGIIRFCPWERSKGAKLRGEILYGEDHREQYESAADGLRRLLVLLSGEREDEFLTACQSTSAFQRPERPYIAKANTREEAVTKVYYPQRGVTCLLASIESNSKWWISGNSNNQAKWSMAKAAIEVANEIFGDRLVLENAERTSWPDRIV